MLGSKKNIYTYFILVFCIGCSLWSHENFLIAAPSPYFLENRFLESNIDASWESGAIPGFFYNAQFHYGINDFLNCGLGFTLANFYEAQVFRFADYQLELKLRPLHILYSDLFFYGLFQHTVGEPVSALYTGDLSTIFTVISPHTDQGIDLGLGMTGEYSFNQWPGGIFMNVEYRRTEFRQYYDVFLENEEYKNRFFLDFAPYWRPDIFPGKNLSLTITQQNRFIFWNTRGFMYDLMHQAVLQFKDKGNIYAGVTLPIVGGQVYKINGGMTLQIDTGHPKIKKIVIQNLYFPPDQAILLGSENEKSDQNLRRLERLYRQIQAYPGYKIVIEGHTSCVYWNDAEKKQIEQNTVLLPLSRARAKSVADALVQMGIPRSQIEYNGVGGEEPIVPYFIRGLQPWNRRVVIKLIKI